MSRRINAAGLELIKSFEGFRAEAYKDSVGVWTIGWGSTKGVKAGMRISTDEAEARLREDLREAESAVERLVKVPLTDNQFAALVSFVFNVGAGNFSKSTLRKKLNQGSYSNAAMEFPRWNKAGGKVLHGLTRRRQAEWKLFLSDAP